MAASMTRRRENLRRCLQKLSNGLGVKNPKLKDLLHGDLRALAVALRVDPNRNDLDVRFVVADYIDRHLQRVTPRTEKKTITDPLNIERYKNAVAVMFNIAAAPVPKDEARRGAVKIAHLSGMILTDRLRWMDEAEVDTYRPAAFKVAKRTAQRYFDDAVEQIVGQLAILDRQVTPEQELSPQPLPADTTPNTSATPAVVDALPQPKEVATQLPAVENVENGAIPESETAGESSSPEQAPLPRLSRRRLALVGIATVAILVATGIVVAISFNSGTGTAGFSSLSTTTASPATGPVHVDSASYVRDGSGTAAWSFVFPDKRQFSAGDLATLNSLNGNAAGYASWLLAHGGVNPNDARLKIDLRGNADTTVTVTDLQVVKQCQAPLTGTLLYSPAAGPASDLNLAVDLDQQFPVVQAYRDGKPSGSYFGERGNGHHIDLAPGETTTLLFDVTTSRQFCQFSFNLVVDTPDGTVVEPINDKRQPFQVTALVEDATTQTPRFASYQAVYAGGVASPARNATFAPVDPTTYQGQ